MSRSPFFSSYNDIGGYDLLITPGTYDTFHELSTEQALEPGGWSHKAYILGPRAARNDALIDPHRGYLINAHPVWFTAPILYEVYVWLDMTLSLGVSGDIDDWFSPITIGLNHTDDWSNPTTGQSVFTALISATAPYMHLVHIPTSGKEHFLYQASKGNGGPLFPQKQWVRLTMYIEGSAGKGYAELYQDQVLVSSGYFTGGDGYFSHFHAGMYASPKVASGKCYNDNHTIREVKDKTEFFDYLNKKPGKQAHTQVSYVHNVGTVR